MILNFYLLANKRTAPITSIARRPKTKNMNASIIPLIKSATYGTSNCQKNQSITITIATLLNVDKMPPPLLIAFIRYN